jgi:hypothetical protein
VTRAKDAAAVQGREPNLQAGADASKHGKEAVASLGHRNKWSTLDEGRRIEREDASSLAREMHEERRAGRKGGKAEVATGCDELGGATHGELPSSLRRRRGGYGMVSRRKGGGAKAKVRTDLD